METLEIRALKKSFGTHEVLKNVDLSVPAHSVYGFIGQNGAGKTTTMRIVLGLLDKDAGEVYVCKEAVKYGETRTNRHIGYLPDVPEFYGYMTSEEYLSLCGSISGMRKETIKKRSSELLSIVGLKENRKKRIGGYSRGMKQRLGIAQALLNEPKLLICDEPTSALDPVGRKEILDILNRVKETTTVIFSTHILADVERICDSVAILHNGSIMQSGNLEELKALHMTDSLLIEIRHQKDMEHLLKELEGMTAEQTSDRSVIVRANEIYEAQYRILTYLAKSRTEVGKLEIREPSLENLFMEAVQ